MSIQPENSLLLKVIKSTETQTDFSIQEQVSQYSCNINPPSLSAIGAVPIISQLPMSYFFVKQVLVENNETVFKSTLPSLSWYDGFKNIITDSSTQTDISGSEFNYLYNQCLPMHDSNFYANYYTNLNNNNVNASEYYNQPAQPDLTNIMYTPVNNNYCLDSQLVHENNVATYNDFFVYHNGYYYVSRVATQVVPVPHVNPILYPMYCNNYNQQPLPMGNIVYGQPVYMNNIPVNQPSIEPDLNSNIVETNNHVQEEVKKQADVENNNAEEIKMAEKFALKVCGFCRSNREAKTVYTSHQLRGPKDIDGNSSIECPILRKYICKICGATGDNAHTESHCPRNINKGISTAKIVTRTLYNSSGNIRRPMI